MLTYNIDLGDGGRGKVALPNWQSLQVNSWLWEFLRTLKNTYENVPTILSKIVGCCHGNTFVKSDSLVKMIKTSERG